MDLMEVEKPVKTDISHPELLSIEEIKEQLFERGISPNEYAEQDKEALLELYYKFACPMPQRKYRMNRRGRVMAKSQITISKRKRTFQDMAENSHSVGRTYTVAKSTGNQDQEMKEMPKSGLINQFNLSVPNGGRLKPPPVVIDPRKKVVKLGGAKSSSSSTGPSSLQRKQITFSTEPNKSQSNASNDLNKIVINKDIKKRTATSVGLDHVVINSNIRKSTGNDSVTRQAIVTDKKCTTQETDSTSDVLTSQKVEHAVENKTSVKIKLKRRSDIRIPSTEEILGNMQIDSEKGSCEPNSNGETQTKSPTKSKPVLLSPKQRQLSLINKTLTLSPSKSTEETTDKSGQNNAQKTDDEDVVTKKFKRVAISWP